MKLFLPLACIDARKSSYGYVCSALPAYKDTPETHLPNPELRLDAIVYGHFETPEAENAYLTYASSVEPHATNFGGGVLFKRDGDKWRLAGWYPGHQADTCLALPGQGLTRLLCRFEHIGGGADETSLGVMMNFSPEDVEWHALLNSSTPDDLYNRPCENRKPEKAWPLSVSLPLHESGKTGFARATVTYVSPGDLAAACKAGHFSSAKRSRLTLRLVMDGESVKVVSPVPLDGVN